MSAEFVMFASFVVLILAAIVALATIRRWRAASRKGAQIAWLRRELRRSLQQLESDDPQLVMAALQTVTILNDAETRAAAVPIIERLAMSATSDLAEAAKRALDRLRSA